MTGLASGKKLSGQDWTCHDANGRKVRAPKSPAMDAACQACREGDCTCSCEHCDCLAIEEAMNGRR
jgi:hypothetical protein